MSGFGALQNLPIAKRAWVVQERLEAPRVLHFGSDQLFWECRDVILASESVPLGLPLLVTDYYGRRAFTTGLPSERLSTTQDGHTSSPSSPYEPWQSIVQEYTSCSLTYPDKDKLSALAGVAREEAMLRDDPFIVGFFRADILWDLVWFVNPRHLGLTKRALDERRAPTWSWVCMDGPISFRMRWGGGSTLNAKLKGITMDQHNNAYSGFQNGAIEIESFLVPAMCMKDVGPTGMVSVNILDPPSDSTGSLNFDWSLNLFFDDMRLVTQTETRIDLLRIESEQRLGMEGGLILRWNDISKAYNRLGIFLATSSAAEKLRSRSIACQSVEIE